jgi:hypothetical protein
MQKVCPVDVIDGAVRRINAFGWLFLGIVNLSLAWLFHNAFAHLGLLPGAAGAAWGAPALVFLTCTSVSIFFLAICLLLLLRTRHEEHPTLAETFGQGDVQRREKIRSDFRFQSA